MTKSIYIMFAVFLFTGCIQKRPALSSFQNKWGVVCFVEIDQNFGADPIVFLPLKDQSDSSLISDKSSIFEYRYNIGMRYYDQSQSSTNYKIYWISDHKQVLYIKENNGVRFYWTFAKLNYHVLDGVIQPKTEKTSEVLFHKQDKLYIEYFDVAKSVAVDTAIFKKKWVTPPPTPADLLWLKKTREKAKRHDPIPKFLPM